MSGPAPRWAERPPAFPHLVKWVEMAVRARVDRAIRPHPVSTVQLLLLVMLEELGEATSAQLARTMQLTPQAMTTLLKPLAERGLIARTPDPTHRRRVLLRLANEGRALLADIRRSTTEVEESLLAALSPAERVQLHALLMRVATSLI
ncbi:MarR family winged helix-turn-helix transcriptional regulator [Sphingomonas baiyangensis]|nr:MarR family transcriptional regulator [Sphingomonas baiyangensis]